MVDGVSVALDCAHQKLASFVAGKFSRKAAASSASESEAAVVPSEDARHDGKVNHSPDSVLAAEAAVAVHERKHARVNPTPCHSRQKRIDVDAAAASRAAVTVEDIRSFCSHNILCLCVVPGTIARHHKIINTMRTERILTSAGKEVIAHKKEAGLILWFCMVYDE